MTQYLSHIATGEPSMPRVPGHWQVLRVKNVGNALIGLTYDPEDVVDSANEGTLVLRSGNIQDGRLDLADNVYVAKSVPEDLRLRCGDIVICARNGSAHLVGKNAVATAEVVGQTWGAFMAVLRSAHNDYLRWVLNSQIFAAQTGLFSTATINQLTSGTLRNLRFAMPPPEEQWAIADYLDRETARIDTLIEEQQRLIEMLRERRTAVIAHATSQGKDVEFRRVIAVLRQGWSPNCENWPADGVADWGVLKVGCANTGRFERAENKRLPDEEIPRPEFAVRRDELVMSRSNTKDLVGAAAVVDGDYPRLLLSDLTYGISLTADADPAFVAYALAAPSMRAQISAASKGMSHSMQKISQRDIRELRVRLPALPEQQRIAASLAEQTAKIDGLIAETERFIELSKERRAALITAAVTGQIDVREMV